MKVRTKTRGTVDVPDEKIVFMPQGLFGFEDYTKFAIIDSEYRPFSWLQSVQNEKLAFLMIDPFIVCDDYEIDIDDASLKAIEIRDPADVYVMTIVTVPADGGPVTANFQGPIVFNKRNNMCMQAISGDIRWPTKFDIMKGLKARRGSC